MAQYTANPWASFSEAVETAESSGLYTMPEGEESTESSTGFYFDPSRWTAYRTTETLETDSTFVYDPATAAGGFVFEDWMTRIEGLGGSEQSVFDLGTPTRRWKTLYVENDVDVLSDQTRKKHIRDCPLGIDFLMTLRPVSFAWKRGAEGTFHGFLGQEVAAASKGIPFAGVAESNGTYSLRYNQLMAPIVKAVQQQQATITDLQSEIAVLKGMLHALLSKAG